MVWMPCRGARRSLASSLSDRGAHGDDGVGHPRQRPLDERVDRCGELSKVARKDGTVKGVDRDGNPHKGCSDTAEGARFGGMRMHHVGPMLGYETADGDEASEVINRPDGASERWHDDEVEVFRLRELVKIPLVNLFLSEDEGRVVARRVEARG